MNKRLRRMATVLMASIVVVGILGASQAVSARDLLGKDLPGDVSAQQPGELFESGNTGQNVELVGHLGGMEQTGKTPASPALQQRSMPVILAATLCHCRSARPVTTLWWGLPGRYTYPSLFLKQDNEIGKITTSQGGSS